MNIHFFDIDGTLANGYDVPQSAAEAIRKIRANGDLTFICTGRPVSYARRHFGEYADGFVCFNGRYGVLNDQVLYDCPLTDEQVNEIISRLNKLKAGYVFFNNDEDHLFGYQDGTIPSLAYNFNISFNDFDHFKRIIEATKDICIYNPHGSQLHADATILGSDKGTAIEAIVEKLNIDPENTYAYGDGANDVSMLNAVRHSVAMGNALPQTKKAAEFVTASIDDDGIMKAMMHYGLI